MQAKEKKVTRSFTISIGDFIFQVQPNILYVAQNTENGQKVMSSEVREEDMAILESFANKSREILAPFPGNSIVYSIVDGPQKITLMKNERDVYTLIINDQIQFTTNSEVIYHEALVSPAIASLNYTPSNFLILGGGDGLAAKQILKENEKANITLVDFDRNITDMFTYDPIMTEFNNDSLKKCKVINEDAFEFVKTHTNTYDVIICDFPDPDNEIFNKLYSQEFYLNVKNLLNPNGAISVQSGSLLQSSKCFLCINKTLESAGFKTIRYYTPTSYGELVYSLGKIKKIPEVQFKNSYESLNQDYFDKAMRTFRPSVFSLEDVTINTVENKAALNYRLSELKLI